MTIEERHDRALQRHSEALNRDVEILNTLMKSYQRLNATVENTVQEFDELVVRTQAQFRGETALISVTTTEMNDDELQAALDEVNASGSDEIDDAQEKE